MLAAVILNHANAILAPALSLSRLWDHEQQRLFCSPSSPVKTRETHRSHSNQIN